MKRLGLIGVVPLIVACGSGPAQPSPAQMAGTWTGTITLASAAGGDCLALLFGETVGVPFSVFPFPITQSNRVIDATIPLSFTGNDCLYSGTVDGDTFLLNATASCGMIRSPQFCRNGDERVPRDVKFVGATISGRVQGNTASTTAIEKWDVFLPGTTASVGMLTLTSSLKLNR